MVWSSLGKMKKIILAMIFATISSVTHAESELDDLLKYAGIVDADYVYTDTKLAAEFFRLPTNQYAQSLPMNINSYIQIESAMMTPHFGSFEAIYTVPFDATERKAVIQELSSMETLQIACIDYYIPNDFMLANNYTLVYSYSDQDYRPLAKITMNIDSCYEALNQ